MPQDGPGTECSDAKGRYKILIFKQGYSQHGHEMKVGILKFAIFDE